MVFASDWASVYGIVGELALIEYEASANKYHQGFMQ